MRAIYRPKIGLAAVMCTPFRGRKEENYRTHSESLEKLAHELDFDLKICQQGIYSQEQADAAAGELKEWDADFVILQAASFAAGSFIYPFAKLFNRLGLWSVPEGLPTREGGLPLNSFTAMNLYNSIIRTCLHDHPSPVKWFLGDPGQPLFDTRLEVTVRALRALLNLDGARIGLIGGVAQGFDNLIIDDSKLEDRLGITIKHIDFDQLMGQVMSIDESLAKQSAAQIRASATKFDENQAVALQKSGYVNLALQKIFEDDGLDAIALSCWPQFQADYHFAVCSVMGQLNSCGLVAACEGDVTSAVNMLMLHYLTNGEVVTLMDMATVDPSDESILLWHCGPTSPLLADENGVRIKSLWLFDGLDGDQTGLHNDLVLKPGSASVLGFNTDFNHMLILDGRIDNTKPSYSGSRGWFRSLRINGEPVSTLDLVQTLMVSGYQHHYPLAYGDLSAAGLEICAWLGIEPIKPEIYTTYLK